MLNLHKSGLHLLHISVQVLFPLEHEFSSSLLPSHGPSPPSIPSLSTLMNALERTRARIRKEQDATSRTQKRQNQLRGQKGREKLLVEKTTKELELSDRTVSLSRSLFEARREAFILRQQTERLSRSYSLISRLCFLLCACLAFCLVFLFVVLCDKRWQRNTKSQVDFKG
jgi:hypothetical protein